MFLEIINNYHATRNPLLAAMIQKKAYQFVLAHAFLKPELVGSYAMGIDIPGSDMDFAIGAKDAIEKEKIRAALAPYMEFRGERPAAFATTRFLFCTSIDGTHIDLNIMDFDDYTHLVNGMHAASNELTLEEKAYCVARKIKLKAKNKDDFEVYKLGLYQRFCPQLLWLPDFQIRALIEKDCIEKQRPFPQWLIAKKQHDRK